MSLKLKELECWNENQEPPLRISEKEKAKRKQKRKKKKSKRSKRNTRRQERQKATKGGSGGKKHGLPIRALM